MRDVLFASDLVDAMLAGHADAKRLAGTASNVGGGVEDTLSLLELLDLIEDLGCARPPVAYAEERVGDQRWYVSDTSLLREATGWRPQVDVETGLESLYRWVAGSTDGLLAATRVR